MRCRLHVNFVALKTRPRSSVNFVCHVQCEVCRVAPSEHVTILRFRGHFVLSKFSFHPAGSDAHQHLGSREKGIQPSRPSDLRRRPALGAWFVTASNATARETPKRQDPSLWKGASPE